MATLTDRSGLYSHPAFSSHWDHSFMCKADYVAEVQRLGNAWCQTGEPPQEVKDFWSKLIRGYQAERIDQDTPKSLEWKALVFKLLSIADEASGGVGYPVAPEPARPMEDGDPKTTAHRLVRPDRAVALKVYEQYVAWASKPRSPMKQASMGGTQLPFVPHSICYMVPPAVACVQPKASTPSVGCTLRSLTHHLALLPPIGQVTTFWKVAVEPDDRPAPFNILVVPYPFSLPGQAFSPTAGPVAPSGDRAFNVRPEVWTSGTSPEGFVEFLGGLIEEARKEMEPVHAILLPEGALPMAFADAVARLLAEKTDVELFLTGSTSSEEGSARNLACLFRLLNGEVTEHSFQSKHHRWCLEKDQVTRYQLGHVLDPENRWWEEIDVSYRHCYLTVFRPGAVLSVLVCEDLARYDPVLTVMNSIGPNLVIALLMDGPQIDRRWSARYATSLADDPGSSVLTVTSLGMIARSSMPGDFNNREVALWKEPGGSAVALKLPKGDHALLLSLTPRKLEQWTLDGRSDGKNTVRFGLSAAHSLRVHAPPAWLGDVN